MLMMQEKKHQDFWSKEENEEFFCWIIHETINSEHNYANVPFFVFKFKYLHWKIPLQNQFPLRLLYSFWSAHKGWKEGKYFVCWEGFNFTKLKKFHIKLFESQLKRKQAGAKLCQA